MRRSAGRVMAKAIPCIGRCVRERGGEEARQLWNKLNKRQCVFFAVIVGVPAVVRVAIGGVTCMP